MLLNEIHIRDPFILPYGGYYYMYGTRCENRGVIGFDVYVSSDLTEWSEPKAVFTKPEGFWSDRDYWAPEVHFYRGRFYMFASFKAEGVCRGTQILSCDTPDGEFTVHSATPVTPSEWECLDGTLYVDASGTPYIVFCHEWVQVKDGEMCVLRLSDDLKTAIGKPRLLFRASQSPFALSNTENYVTDGPFMFRTKSGRLLLLWSTFSEHGYIEGIAESDNGEIDGNFIQLDKPLFYEDGGHGMMFIKYDGTLLFVMHSPNRSPFERPVMIKPERLYD